MWHLHLNVSNHELFTLIYIHELFTLIYIHAAFTQNVSIHETFLLKEEEKEKEQKTDKIDRKYNW